MFLKYFRDDRFLSFRSKICNSYYEHIISGNSTCIHGVNILSQVCFFQYISNTRFLDGCYHTRWFCNIYPNWDNKRSCYGSARTMWNRFDHQKQKHDVELTAVIFEIPCIKKLFVLRNYRSKRKVYIFFKLFYFVEMNCIQVLILCKERNKGIKTHLINNTWNYI